MRQRLVLLPLVSLLMSLFGCGGSAAGPVRKASAAAPPASPAEGAGWYCFTFTWADESGGQGHNSFCGRSQKSCEQELEGTRPLNPGATFEPCARAGEAFCWEAPSLASGTEAMCYASARDCEERSEGCAATR